MPKNKIHQTPATIQKQLTRGEYPRVYINACTHGNERVGYKILKELQGLVLVKGTLVLGVANTRAFKANKRFIDQDLNRSFPGKIDGNHEERLATQIMSAVRAADIVIDIHSTESGVKDSMIITKDSKKIRTLIDAVGPKRVLHMHATKNIALISSTKLGIAFEYGKDKDPRTCRATVRGIRRVLGCLGMINIERTYAQTIKRGTVTKHYLVGEAVEKPAGFIVHPKVKNFRIVKKGQVIGVKGGKTIRAHKAFYPVLFGKNTYKTIFGFASELIQ